MIVITGPTSHIGSQVLERVINGPGPVRVIVRDPLRLPARLRDRLDIHIGSHKDELTVQRAFEGAERIFWLTPGSLEGNSRRSAYLDFSWPAVQAVRKFKIRHVVAVSTLGEGWPNKVGAIADMLAMDDLFAGSGVHYRALACAPLMDNLLSQIDSIAEQGEIQWPCSVYASMPFVAASDVAAVASELLLNPQWNGAERLPMMGPRDISFAEITAIMSATFSRAIRFRTMSSKVNPASRTSQSQMAHAVTRMLTAEKAKPVQHFRRPQPNLTTTDFHSWCTEVLLSAVWERR
jgi:uncharacterized protein YbjT (DUF2867 family)